MKLTTTASGRIAGSKRQINEALCTIAGKKAIDRKKYYVTRTAAHTSQKIKAVIAICIALTVCYL